MSDWWVNDKPTAKNITNRIDFYTAVKEEPQNPGWTHLVSAEKIADIILERDKLRATVAELEGALVSWETAYPEEDYWKRRALNQTDALEKIIKSTGSSTEAHHIARKGLGYKLKGDKWEK